MEGPQPGQTVTPQLQNGNGSQEPPAASQTAPTTRPAVSVGFTNEAQHSGATASTDETMVLGNLRSSPANDNAIQWSASEFIEHSKSKRWYMSLAGVTLVLSALVFIITRDKISTSVIIVAALAFGIFAARKPRVLEYRLDEGGLTIATKFYAYEQFKSFSVMDEGPVASIYLLPLKRFMPALSLYYSEADEARILEMLSDRLPLEERQVDKVDRIKF
jgi:hypothetical protein